MNEKWMTRYTLTCEPLRVNITVQRAFNGYWYFDVSPWGNENVIAGEAVHSDADAAMYAAEMWIKARLLEREVTAVPGDGESEGQ